jgi:hypothetical protein
VQIRTRSGNLTPACRLDTASLHFFLPRCKLFPSNGGDTRFLQKEFFREQVTVNISLVGYSEEVCARGILGKYMGKIHSL